MSQSATHLPATRHRCWANPPGDPVAELWVRERESTAAPLYAELVGELCTLTSPGIARALFDEIDAGPTFTIIDMSQVTFCDRRGLALVIEARRRLRESGAELELVAPSRPVTRLLEIVGLDFDRS